MEKKQNIQKSLKNSIWIAYILIVFEILYMISPFALYYYSVYKAPLNFLNSNPHLAFLTGNILPHFTSHNSFLISILFYLCWPLIIIGGLVFLLGFCQVYFAKFTRKGVVSGGLYKIIRHPQYVGLALLGLGTTIFWSRFIIFIVYFTMLYLYYFLAKQEERICIEKYGENYKKYIEETGMFFPKKLERFISKILIVVPPYGTHRMSVIIATYMLFICILIIAGFAIKDYSISNLNIVSTEKTAIIAVSSMRKEDIKKISNAALSDSTAISKLAGFESDKYLIYIMPSGWGIPELGVIGNDEKLNYLSSSATHGNYQITEPGCFLVLVAKPILSDHNSTGEDLVKNSVSFVPLIEISVDMNSNKIFKIKERENRGKWDGVPVPVF